MTTNPNDNAYPEIGSDSGYDSCSEESYTNVYSNGGLTKREYFAAMVLQGLVSQREVIDAWARDDQPAHLVPRLATKVADELIQELNKDE